MENINYANCMKRKCEQCRCYDYCFEYRGDKNGKYTNGRTNKKIREQLIEIIKPIVKSILEIYKKIKEMLIKNWLKLKSFIEKEDRVNKYIKIYKKTKNRRIQKKQVAKIVKMLQEYKK